MTTTAVERPSIAEIGKRLQTLEQALAKARNALNEEVMALTRELDLERGELAVGEQECWMLRGFLDDAFLDLDSMACDLLSLKDAVWGGTYAKDAPLREWVKRDA